MQELKIIKENALCILLEWSKLDNSNLYVVEGRTHTFCYEPIEMFTDNRCIISRKNISRYDFLRIKYAYKDNNTSNYVTMDVSNDVKLVTELDKITLTAVRSYAGGAISFASATHYDKYCLHCLSEPQKNVELETEDCLISGPLIIEGNKYIVSAYNRTEDSDYKLAAVSMEYICTFEFIRNVSKPAISIVIPVYNCYHFLARTIDSVLLSSFNDMEILLVDDASSDGCEKICDWYENIYSCIKVFHKDNGGVCSARNYGMDNAAGDFIAFVDDDDIVHPYMYEKLYKAAVRENADISIAQTISRDDVNSYNMVLTANNDSGNTIMNSFDEVISAKGSADNIYFVAVWNKIIRRNIAQKVRFVDEHPYFEDTAYTSSVYSYAHKFILVNGAYYIWDKRKQKTIGTLTSLYKKETSENLWKYYILSYANPLFSGDKSDHKVVIAYKYDIIRQLLEDYATKGFTGVLKNLFIGMIKHLVHKYDIPVEKLLVSHNKTDLLNAWNEIQMSKVSGYDGRGEVPKSYYK